MHREKEREKSERSRMHVKRKSEREAILRVAITIRSSNDISCRSIQSEQTIHSIFSRFDSRLFQTWHVHSNKPNTITCTYRFTSTHEEFTQIQTLFRNLRRICCKYLEKWHGESSGIHVSTLNMQHSGSAMIFQPKRWNFRAKPTPTEKPPFFFDENLFLFSSRMKMDPFNKSMLRCCCCCFRPYGIKVYYYWTSKTPFFVIDCMPFLTHTPLITILVRSFVCLENEKISIFAHLFCP